MAEPQTKVNDADINEFLDSVENDKRRADTKIVVEIMERVTGHPATMWGTSIIGFDTYTYKYESGKTGDWMITGVSPRKSSLSVYIMPGFESYGDLLGKLGKHKTGRSCLYINKLDDVDLGILEELIAKSVKDMREKYPR